MTRAALYVRVSTSDRGIAKAERRNACTVVGDHGSIEAAVDSCVTAIVKLTPANTGLPSCPMAGAPCGSCGSGRCETHCGASGPMLVCLDPTKTSGACLSDVDCGGTHPPICGGYDHLVAACEFFPGGYGNCQPACP